ncbi:MAG: hypothetical protein RLY70_3723 [Planctomycetota bacterium]
MLAATIPGRLTHLCGAIRVNEAIGSSARHESSAGPTGIPGGPYSFTAEAWICSQTHAKPRWAIFFASAPDLSGSFGLSSEAERKWATRHVSNAANLENRLVARPHRTVSAGEFAMDPDVLEAFTQSRWAIAFTTVAIAAVWLRQRGKTQRLALLCATACETADPSVPGVPLAVVAELTNVGRLAHAILAFGKLPEVTQRRCALIGIIAVPLGIIFSFSALAMIYGPDHRSHVHVHRAYSSSSHRNNADRTGANGPTATADAASTARATSTSMSKSTPTLTNWISVVSVSATIEEEGVAPIPSLNPVVKGTSVLAPPTVDPFFAAESSFTSIDRPASQRHGRFDRLAALTQCSCHEMAAISVRMESNSMKWNHWNYR